MQAFGIKKDVSGIAAFDTAQPAVSSDTEVLVRILESGIDGTDRSILKWKLLDPPPGEDSLVLGHEGVGRVEETGSGVQNLKPGDFVVPTVRRGCGRCSSCLHDQSDMCSTGLYTERGIHKLHGFFTEHIVEQEDNLLLVPAGLEELAVLTEPLSIGEKAIAQIKIIQSRLPWPCDHPHHRFETEAWGHCKKALVLGVGPLGFLTTALLVLAGVDTYVAINRPKDNLKVKLTEGMGAHYIDSRDITAEQIMEITGPVDIIIESSGASQFALDVISTMGRNAICVFVSIPRGKREVTLDGDGLLRQIVRYNQVIIGSVNSNRGHFESAIRHLGMMKESFGPVIEQAITERYSPGDYRLAFEEAPKDQIKGILDFSNR